MKTLQDAIDRIYFNYACRALLGGGKGEYVMKELKHYNPQYYKSVMKAAREHLRERGLKVDGRNLNSFSRPYQG